MQETLTGTILKGIGSFYYILCDDDGREYQLRARGKLRHWHLSPLIGDRVRFIPGDSTDGSLEEILPRQNELIRPAVANIQYLMIVIAPCPEPDLLMVDTLLAMAAKQSIRPVLVVNKSDLDSRLYTSILEQYGGLNAPVLCLSAWDGKGLDELRSLLRQGICCFAGQSGVGKSSLTAAATGIEVETGEISHKISRGRHTTRHAELLIREDYRVLDTPGFSLLELWQGLEPIQLQEYYPEFLPFNDRCRFSPCYHDSEPGCAVLEAAGHGAINAQRVERYRILLEKAREAWKNRYH